jgi:chromosomal replication initiator protein
MLASLLARSRAAVLVDEPFYLASEAQFAWAAAARCSERSPNWEQRGRLTCLIGGEGAGKSILCRQAIRDAVRRHPKWKFAFQSAAEWLHDVACASETGRFEPFCDACGRLAIVACDDLDQMVADESSLELWTTWLDELLVRGVQVLVTLSSPPSQCPGFAPRLVSRLHGGLCARMPPLERDGRQALIRFAADQHQLPLSDDVVAWLADRPPGTPRELCDAVERLSKQRRLTDLAAIQRFFSQQTRPLARPLLAIIAHEVAGEFSVSVTDLRSQSRQQAFRLPRQCAMFLAHDLARCPMEEIGRFFGRRAHTSVSHSCRRLQELLPGSPTLREHVARLRQRLVHALREDCA